MKILLVEDEALVAMALQWEIESHGHTCRIAATEEKALTATEELRPDIVFMDIHLAAGSDGLVAAGRINRDYHIPICFMSGYGRWELDPDEIGFEPLGYLEKPISWTDIAPFIEKTN